MVLAQDLDKVVLKASARAVVIWRLDGDRGYTLKLTHVVAGMTSVRVTVGLGERVGNEHGGTQHRSHNIFYIVKSQI